MEYQQRERSDTHFSRTCLFCKQHFEGNRFIVVHFNLLKYYFELKSLILKYLNFKTIECHFCSLMK